MQSLSIENPRSSATPDFPESAAQERRVTFFIFAATLGFISTGYHLSILNSSSIFLWLGCSDETDFYTFKAKCDAFYLSAGFLTALLIALNKIKFHHDLIFLKIADVIMIFGTLAAFTIFSEKINWILFGRVIAGVAAGINVTITLSFVREAQFYLSQSSFKPEKRRTFMDVSFALGIFLGFLPSQLIPKIMENGEYLPGEHEEFDIARPDLDTCWQLCIVPIVASVARIVLLFALGDVKPPEYAAAFTDELASANDEEEEENGGLYMIKFKETRSLIKLFKDPYRLRLFFCLLLTFTQMWSGIVLFIVNPLYLSMSLKKFFFQDETVADVQWTITEYGIIYFITTTICSLILRTCKLPRRVFMYIGFGLGAVTSGVASIMIIFGHTTYLRGLIYWYCFSVSVGMGPAIELFHEEVLPAKGLQFLAAIKWLLLTGCGLATAFTLRYLQTYIIQTLSLFSMCGLVVYIIYELLPETYDVDPKDVHTLFEFVEDLGDAVSSQSKDTTTPVLSPTLA